MFGRRPIALATVVTLGLLLAACDGGEARGAGNSAPTRVERSDDPRAAALRTALEQGQTGAARTLYDQVAPRLGAEGPTLEARLLVLEGDVLGALRVLEAAKTDWPGDGRPFAAAAELYAGLGRLQAAQDEVDRGQAVVGRTPALIRALGIVGIATPGGAQSGLQLLEEARRADPNLPFCTEPLATARTLVARIALQQPDLPRAEALARGALELRPGDADARVTLADVLEGKGDFEPAVVLMEALFEEGEVSVDDLRELLTHAATAAMVERDLARQLAHLLRARELGATEAQLGFGATVLRREAQSAIDRGREAQKAARLLDVEGADEELRAMRAEKLAEAEGEYLYARRLDPEAIEAFHRLAQLEWDRGDYREAALAWESAAARVRTLPEGSPRPAVPLHENAAQAWRKAGRPDLARDTLTGYLAEEPEGEWAASTRALLVEIEAADE
ncbi:tetratricopeptide repeat protein [Engelhardtia mirabilis]|uniref:Uncharacterized protein n=1 Tax=Engelhardtia mirabilis TaxID=2528011 RepID=A0A518BIA3_9BACT|nr:hypothetical protein Pla133_17490 [Planctomycetes bacterium Pla133]QDV00999.1 hypothetical protein Pla86_17480 [Planctomycetes bacterium Pla86]